METKEKKRFFKIIGAIAAVVAFIASAITVTKFVSGNDYLPDFFHSNPTSAQAYEVGEIIHFGKWDWRVLDVQDDKVLLIAEEVLELRSYHEEETSNVTWRTCALRDYLNSEFYKTFSARERKMITETRNRNTDNQWYGTDGGQITIDKVFLLSIEEVIKYFGDSGQLENRPNDPDWYINDQYNDERAAPYGNNDALWWLRSPGLNSISAASIGISGNVYLGGATYDTVRGVRPALWLKLT